MKKTYTTAMGRSIDFESLKSAGEEVIAVGNMKVNARGDQLGPGGVVERPRNAAMADHYNAGMMQQESLEDKILRQKMAGANTKKSKLPKKTQDNSRIQNMPEENTNDQSSDQPQTETKEESEATSTQTLPDKRLRGSLASSLAKEATVTQEKMPDPRKPKGISRI
jgi:hypothetical protein